MNIADKVNTVLDLSGYNSLETQFDLTDPTTLITLLGEILALGGICLFFFGLISVSEKARKIAEGGICGMVLGGALLAVVFILSSPSEHTFSNYVNEAYGFESSSLPDSKPEDGSLSMVWKKNGEIHSGTLNLLDNKVSIKETGGDYLKVTEQASQKNGE